MHLWLEGRGREGLPANRHDQCFRIHTPVLVFSSLLIGSLHAALSKLVRYIHTYIDFKIFISIFVDMSHLIIQPSTYVLFSLFISTRIWTSFALYTYTLTCCKIIHDVTACIRWGEHVIDHHLYTLIHISKLQANKRYLRDETSVPHTLCVCTYFIW